MRSFTLIALFLLTPLGASAANSECRQVSEALRVLGNSNKDFEERSRLGSCLLRHHVDHPEVARLGLKILRDSSEDILLKEDLMEAFSEGQIRRKVKLEGKLAPEMGQQERDAVDRALSGAGSLLAAAQAVKSMEETVPVTHLEVDYFRVISDIALDDTSPVLLRAAAVSALERLSVRVVNSGIYDEKSVRLVRETLRTVAARDDDSSYFTNAGTAYNRLAAAGIPGYSREISGGGRMISSVKNPSDK